MSVQPIEYRRHDSSARAEELTAAGLNPWGGDDTVLHVAYVYCDQHVNVHGTGWCTVSLRDKIALVAATQAEAVDEAHALGFWLHGEPRPCQHCGQMVTQSPQFTDVDQAGSIYCEPDNKRSRTHRRIDI